MAKRAMYKLLGNDCTLVECSGHFQGRPFCSVQLLKEDVNVNCFRDSHFVFSE